MLLNLSSQSRQGDYVEGANEVASFIESVGVPVATALGLGGALWWLIKYVLGSIVDKITEAQSQTEQEIRAIRNTDIRELKEIIVGLIDKSTAQQSDLIRLDSMLRVKFGLDLDEKRIARNPDNKVK
jgi:hypothetical protein